MAFPKKTQVAVASHNRTQCDLSCQHITTDDFLNFSVAKAIELVPGQSIDVRHEVFTRLEAMPVPTFGRAKIKNRAYFVPYRTIFPAWNDFITDTPHVYNDGTNAIPRVVPFFRMSDMVRVFTRNTSYAVEVASDADAFDFELVVYTSSTTSTARKYNFTSKGRRFYKLLRSLGYNLTFVLGPSELGGPINPVYSLLPLYSALRVYLDFFYPSQYAGDEDSSFVNSLFIKNDYVDDLGEAEVDDDILKRLFDIIDRVVYDTDYFTSAWDYPNAPNDGLASSAVFYDVNHQGDLGSSTDTYVSYDEGTSAPLIQGNGYLGNITQYALTALKSLTDYMKRHQIVGSRALDRYLSRFGVKLTSEKLNRCVYIGEFSQDLQFGDVTATADTEGAQLGAYAGKGLSYGDGTFSFNSDEYGMLIIVSTIVPQTQYYEGLNRHSMHLDRLDFFTPEFDNLGTQPLSCMEVYTPVDGSSLVNARNYDQQIFGFVPRYAEYKVPYSQITGDYILKSKNVGKDSWTLFRSLKEIAERDMELENFRHSYDFVVARDADQYNRIFYNTDSNADHFNIIHNFDIKSSFPGKSLFDTYEFEDEDKSKKVSVEVGGTTHN